MQMKRLKLSFQMIFHYPCIRLHFILGIRKCHPFRLIALLYRQKDIQTQRAYYLFRFIREF